MIKSSEKPRLISVMTPFPHSIEHDRPLREAEATMNAGHFRHLPVTLRGKLHGIISERDLKLAITIAKDIQVSRELTVGDICVENAYAVEHDTFLEEVLKYMSENRIGSALVTRNQKLVGIFTTTDACRHFAEYLDRTQPTQAA